MNQTDGPPWVSYGPSQASQYPPIMVAQRVGSGAVVAGGFVNSCYSAVSADFVDLIDVIFQWMVPGQYDVLWYENVTGGPRPLDLLNHLWERGYIVTEEDGPITSELLSPYDFLVLPQLQNQLPDSSVAAIKSFVEDGGGLLVMDGSDFGGYNYNNVQNKILEAFNFTMYFQNDQVNDPSFTLYAEVDNTTSIGAAYENATGKDNILLYSICSMAAQIMRSVEVSISPNYRSGAAGTTLTYTITATNTGNAVDNLLLGSSNPLGWSVAWSPTPSRFNNVPPGENRSATLMVIIPSDALPSTINPITVAVQSEGNPTKSDSMVCQAQVISAAAPVGGIAFAPDKLALLAPYIVLAALIAIATVSVAVYWKRR